MAKASKPLKPTAKAAKTKKVIVTEQMLTDNPELVEAFVEVGDEIEIPATESGTTESGTTKTHYQEVKVEVKGKNYEKLKVVRERVMLTDEQAEILNTGILEGSNSIASMYFKAE